METPPQPRPETEARDTVRSLLARFLGFGIRAWGGPAAQLAMIRDEVVAARWLTTERFNRLLGIYQVLPGPEATEMCVHLGYLRRGRVGAVVAGLGFVLPGFLLMLALAWLYVAFGLDEPERLAYLAGFAPAVAALVAAACIRLGTHALHDTALAAVGLGVFTATLLGVPFYVTLPLAGVAYVAQRKGHGRAAAGAAVLALVAWLAWAAAAPATSAPSGSLHGSSTLGLGLSGLKAGLLTFGGAYTSVSFLRADAVGHVVTEAQFVDGLALSGILPAPFIIFATFVGFLGGGWPGAFAMTAGIFLPAFAFTLLWHARLETLANHPALLRFLDGVTAGVIGLLAVTALQLTLGATTTPLAVVLLAAAFVTVTAWRSKWATPTTVLAAGLVGALATAAENM